MSPLVTDNVTEMIMNKRLVLTENGSFSFDYLVLVNGWRPNDFGTPGVKKMHFHYGH